MELRVVPPAERRTVPILLERSQALLETGEYAQALEIVERAAAIDPDVAEAHAKRGRALENLGSERLEEAAAAYRVALSLDPEAHRAREGLGSVLDRLDDRAGAVEQWEEVLRQVNGLSQAGPDLLEVAGRCLFRLGRLPEASDRCERALAIDPTRTSARFDLGLVQLASGARLEAVASYARGLADVASDPTRLGVARAAMDHLGATCREDPDMQGDDVAREILDALAGAVGEPHGRA